MRHDATPSNATAHFNNLQYYYFKTRGNNPINLITAKWSLQAVKTVQTGHKLNPGLLFRRVTG